MPSTNDKNFVDLRDTLGAYEIAEMIGISRGTVYNLISNGALKARNVHGRILVKLDDLKDLVKKSADPPSMMQRQKARTILASGRL